MKDHRDSRFQLDQYTLPLAAEKVRRRAQAALQNIEGAQAILGYEHEKDASRRICSETMNTWADGMYWRIKAGSHNEKFDAVVSELLDAASLKWEESGYSDVDSEIINATCRLVTTIYDQAEYAHEDFDALQNRKLDAIEEYQAEFAASGLRWFARLVLNVVSAAIGAVLGFAATCWFTPPVTAAGVVVGGATGLVVGEAIARNTFFARDIQIDKIASTAIDKVLENKGPSL